MRRDKPRLIAIPQNRNFDDWCRSVRVAEIIEQAANTIDDNRIARRSIHRFIGQMHQRRYAKAGGKTLKAQRGKMPVSVAPRPFQQVQLPPRAFQKRCVQFDDQQRVIPHCRCQIAIQGAIFKSHAVAIAQQMLIRGLTSLNSCGKRLS